MPIFTQMLKCKQRLVYLGLESIVIKRGTRMSRICRDQRDVDRLEPTSIHPTIPSSKWSYLYHRRDTLQPFVGTAKITTLLTKLYFI